MPNSPSARPYRSTRRGFLLETGAATLVASAPLAGASPQKSAAVAPSPSDLIRRTWRASWITVPGAPATEYGVYHFRRTFDLPAKPERFVVHVSGDNRYQLFRERAPGSLGAGARRPVSLALRNR
jgi:hypothetical protein